MKSTHCGRVELPVTRRDAIVRTGAGLAGAALAGLLTGDRALASSGVIAGAGDPLAPKKPNFPAQGRAVISLFMQGGPSQVDTFDPKPELTRLDGQPMPESFQSSDLKLQFMSAAGATLMGSQFPFRKRGQSGLEISDLFKEVATHADDMAVIRSCYHESFIHGPALSLMHTGSLLLSHPSVGSWVVYGLGSESRDLPAYMVLSDGGIRNGNTCYSAGFLPAVYQGTLIRTEGAPIQNLSKPPQVSQFEQRRLLDELQRWNAHHRVTREDDSRLDARIASYELAFRMQSAAPSMIDLSEESKSVRDLYGADTEPTSRWAKMLILARRMVERGVRYVELICADWDGHGECAANHRSNAERIDKPIAGLLSDLKQRGMLDSTLVTWTGEFGRTPIMQGAHGRDHNPYGFTSWLAGAGIQGGKAIGATDELGFRAVDDRVHTHDLHATMLTLLGIDHEQLTYLFAGRKRRLTDVGGQNNLASRLLA